MSQYVVVRQKPILLSMSCTCLTASVCKMTKVVRITIRKVNTQPFEFFKDSIVISITPLKADTRLVIAVSKSFYIFTD